MDDLTVGVIRIPVIPDFTGFDEKMKEELGKQKSTLVQVLPEQPGTGVATGATTAAPGAAPVASASPAKDLLSNLANGTPIPTAPIDAMAQSFSRANQEGMRLSQTVGEISSKLAQLQAQPRDIIGGAPLALSTSGALVRTGMGPHESVYVGPRPTPTPAASWEFAGARQAAMGTAAQGPFFAFPEGTAAMGGAPESTGWRMGPNGPVRFVQNRILPGPGMASSAGFQGRVHQPDLYAQERRFGQQGVEGSYQEATWGAMIPYAGAPESGGGGARGGGNQEMSPQEVMDYANRGGAISAAGSRVGGSGEPGGPPKRSGPLVSRRTFMYSMFGLWEASKAKRAIDESELTASMADSQAIALQAKMQGIEQASGGIFGSIVAEAGNLIGGDFSIKNVRDQVAIDVDRNRRMDIVRDSQLQNKMSGDVRTAGIGSFAGQLVTQRSTLEMKLTQDRAKMSELQQQADATTKTFVSASQYNVQGMGDVDASVAFEAARAGKNVYLTQRRARSLGLPTDRPLMVDEESQQLYMEKYSNPNRSAVLSQVKSMQEDAKNARLDLAEQFKWEASTTGFSTATMQAESAHVSRLTAGASATSSAYKQMVETNAAAEAARTKQLGLMTKTTATVAATPEALAADQAEFSAYQDKQQNNAAFAAGNRANEAEAQRQGRYTDSIALLGAQGATATSRARAERKPYSAMMRGILFQNMEEKQQAEKNNASPEVRAQLEELGKARIAEGLAGTLQDASVQSMEMAGTNNVLSFSYAGQFDEARREQIRNRANVDRLRIPNGPDFSIAGQRVDTRESYESKLLDQQIGYRREDLTGQGKQLDYALAWKTNEAREQGVINQAARDMRGAGSNEERGQLGELAKKQLKLMEQSSLMNGSAVTVNNPWALNFAGGITRRGGEFNLSEKQKEIDAERDKLNAKKDLGQDSGEVNVAEAVGAGFTLDDAKIVTQMVIDALSKLPDKLAAAL